MTMAALFEVSFFVLHVFHITVAMVTNFPPFCSLVHILSKVTFSGPYKQVANCYEFLQ